MNDCDYNFKRESKVYIVYEGFKYLLDISEISFSQTYTEKPYSVKSIQDPKMFEESIINRANPANFTVRIPGIREADLRILFDLSVSIDTFDIYVENAYNLYKVENSVVTTATFVFDRTRPLTLEISGEASKVLLLEGTAPGTEVARSGTRTYNKITDLSIVLDSNDLSELNTNVSMVLENNLTWIPWTSVDGAVQANNTMFPEHFTVDKRVISGSFTQYLVKDAEFFSWSKNVPINLKVGEISGSFYGFELDSDSCSYRTSPNTNEVFAQTYEWRLTQNPQNLADILIYHVI